MWERRGWLCCGCAVAVLCLAHHRRGCGDGGGLCLLRLAQEGVWGCVRRGPRLVLGEDLMHSVRALPDQLPRLVPVPAQQHTVVFTVARWLVGRSVGLGRVIEWVGRFVGWLSCGPHVGSGSHSKSMSFLISLTALALLTCTRKAATPFIITALAVFTLLSVFECEYNNELCSQLHRCVNRYICPFNSCVTAVCHSHVSQAVCHSRLSTVVSLVMCHSRVHHSCVSQLCVTSCEYHSRMCHSRVCHKGVTAVWTHSCVHSRVYHSQGERWMRGVLKRESAVSHQGVPEGSDLILLLNAPSLFKRGVERWIKRGVLKRESAVSHQGVPEGGDLILLGRVQAGHQQLHRPARASAYSRSRGSPQGVAAVRPVTNLQGLDLRAGLLLRGCDARHGHTSPMITPSMITSSMVTSVIVITSLWPRHR